MLTSTVLKLYINIQVIATQPWCFVAIVVVGVVIVVTIVVVVIIIMIITFQFSLI